MTLQERQQYVNYRLEKKQLKLRKFWERTGSGTRQ